MYSRKIDDAVYSFGHEGILYRQSFIMYDKQTNSKWVHTTGEAVQGKAKGQVLKFLPSTVTTWKKWKALHPATTVLTGRKAEGFMGKLNVSKNPNRYGLSIGQGATPKLYPLATLRTLRVINDVHVGTNVVVVFDEPSGTAHAYERGARVFAWKDAAMRDEGGAVWDLLTGQEREGKGRLQQLPGTTWLVARWKGFHPRGPEYAESKEPAKPEASERK